MREELARMTSPVRNVEPHQSRYCPGGLTIRRNCLSRYAGSRSNTAASVWLGSTWWSRPAGERLVLVAHTGAASRTLQEQLMSSELDGGDRRSPASRAILNEQPCIVNYLLADSMLHGYHRGIAGGMICNQLHLSHFGWKAEPGDGVRSMVTATRPKLFYRAGAEVADRSGKRCVVCTRCDASGGAALWLPSRKCSIWRNTMDKPDFRAA